MAANSLFKLVVLAIGSAASDPAMRIDVAETMAIIEALGDNYWGSDGVRFHMRLLAFN